MIKITKTNRSTNKQTNKQTDKHFLKSYISQPNQLRFSPNFQGIFLLVSPCAARKSSPWVLMKKRVWHQRVRWSSFIFPKRRRGDESVCVFCGWCAWVAPSLPYQTGLTFPDGGQTQPATTAPPNVQGPQTCTNSHFKSVELNGGPSVKHWIRVLI